MIKDIKFVRNMKILYCVIFVIAGVVFAGCKSPMGGNSEPESEAETFSFSDANEIIYNPDMGFYSSMDIKVQEDGIYDFAWKKEVISNQSATLYNGTYDKDATFNLIHLKMDISDFSKYGYLRTTTPSNRSDKELTDKALSDISGLLDSLRAGEKTAVIRFSYDPGYSGQTYKVGDEDIFYDVEPESISTVLGHIEKLCPILIEHADVLTAVECGMLGPWGEMHSTKLATGEGNIKAVVTKFLDCLENCDIPLLVRQPAFIYDYLNSSGSIPEYSVDKDSKEYKLGLYNDGYLGSESDSGTFNINRKNEINFMKQFTNHTPYGGELIGDYGLTGSSSPSIEEMNDVCLSFLNIGWNYDVLSNLKSKTKYYYNGESCFDYLIKHMGYRFVLTKSKFTKSSDGKYLRTEFMIKNNGFANLPMNRSKEIQVILCKSGTNVPCATYTLSETFDSTDEKEITITVGNSEINIENLESAERYDVYLKLCNDKGKYAIRFANPSSNWNSALKANYAGTFTK